MSRLMQLDPRLQWLMWAPDDVVATGEPFDCEKLADLLWGFTQEYAAFCEAGPFLSLVLPPAFEILLGVMGGAVGQVDGPWSAVPRLWMPEFGWALEHAFPVLRQVIDARAPLVNAIVGAANTQWRGPLEVLAQHLRTGSGLLLGRKWLRRMSPISPFR